MTRAWLAVLSLRFDVAFAYHPLFWLLPVLLVVTLARRRIRKEVRMMVMGASLVAVLAVWVIRLATPYDQNVLFSDVVTEDVVSVDVPVWLELLCSSAHGPTTIP